MKIIKKYTAFTMLEVMVVVAILSLIVGIGALYSQTSQVRTDVNSQAATFVSYVRLAQSDAQAGRSNASHGVHLESDSYTIFIGSTYNPVDTANFTINLPSTMVIQNSSLNGGGNDIIFNSPYGETNTYGTLEFFSSQINRTLLITITPIGTIEY